MFVTDLSESDTVLSAGHSKPRAFLLGYVKRLCHWIDDDSVVIEEMTCSLTHAASTGHLIYQAHPSAFRS